LFFSNRAGSSDQNGNGSTEIGLPKLRIIVSLSGRDRIIERSTFHYSMYFDSQNIATTNYADAVADVSNNQKSLTLQQHGKVECKTVLHLDPQARLGDIQYFYPDPLTIQIS